GEQFLELGKEKEPDQVHSYVRPVVDTGQAHLNVRPVVGCNMGLSRHNPISYWLRRPIGSGDHPSTNYVIMDKFTLVPEMASALWEVMTYNRLGDKEKGMSAYTGSSRRQSHHNSRGYTESYYQSFRSRGTQPAPKRHHDRKAYSQTFPDVRSAYATISIEESHRVSSGSITAFGWLLEEIHVTWAHLEKKRTRLQTLHQSLLKNSVQCLETASQIFATTSDHTRDDVKKPMTMSERKPPQKKPRSFSGATVIMVMEIDTTPPTLVTPEVEPTNEGRRDVEERTPPITPSNTASNITRNNQSPFVTLMCTETQIVDEAFVTANYSQLEPLMRRRMRELRLQGVATQLDYSSEDVDEEMEAPPEIRLESFGMMREPITGNIPQLLASHLRETKRMRRALSPRGAM
ncbi:hypothetical protein Tco_0863768, partial [Tanacetum coccineum]